RLGIDSESLAGDSLTLLQRLAHLGLDPALAVELALALHDHHLWTLLLGGQRLQEGVAHLADVKRVVDRSRPLHPDSARGLLDRVLGRSRRAVGLRGQDVLTP